MSFVADDQSGSMKAVVKGAQHVVLMMLFNNHGVC